MEPIHYLKTLRRRWWVIVLAVLVAGGAGWVTTKVVSPESTRAATDLGYSTAISLWNPGAPTIGPGAPFTSATTLEQFVATPQVAAIAAKKMHFQGSPVELSTQVQGSLDSLGLFAITGTGKDPQTATTVAESFSQALIVYLEKQRNKQIDQQQQQAGIQVAALVQQGGDPNLIAALRARISKLDINRTTPIALTEFQRHTTRISLAPTAATEGFQAPKSRGLRVLLACIFGLLAGIALALVLERFDTRIRSSKRAEEAFGLPVLAEVPAISRARRKTVVTASHPGSRAAGAFRLVGVGTSRWDATGAKTILVTSPEARDGKTTVAANLAVAHAQTGSRVLVVSCDLRRPAIHESFGVAIQPGLTDALQSSNGNRDLEATLDLAPYVEPCSVVRVGVVPSGVAPDDPGELLGSLKMQQFIERLKRVTDVVILDCAPLVVASDVVPLLPLADGVVLVARAGKTRQELAGNAATLLERQGVSNAGVVLNDAREFAIPLAKRRMYRPTRKMRKAAKRIEKTQGFDEPNVPDQPLLLEEPPVLDEAPAIVEVPEEEPTLGVQIPDMSPSRGESGSGPSIQSSDRQPTLRRAPAAPVAQLLAPERVIVMSRAEEMPDPVVPPQPEPVVPPEPDPIVPPEPDPVVPPEPDPIVPLEPEPVVPSVLGGLQQQLFELRQQLEGFKIEGLSLDPPSNGATNTHPDGADRG